METIHKRLRRVGRIDLWSVFFSGLFQALAGATIGALFAGVGWTVAVTISFVIAICSVVAMAGSPGRACRFHHRDSRRLRSPPIQLGVRRGHGQRRAAGLPISRLPIRMLQHAGFCCHAIPLEHLVDPSLYRLPIPSGATGTLSAPVIRSQLARRLPRHDPTVGSAAESRPRRVMRYLGIEHAWGGAIGDLGPRTATGSSRLKISAPSPRRAPGEPARGGHPRPRSQRCGFGSPTQSAMTRASSAPACETRSLWPRPGKTCIRLGPGAASSSAVPWESGTISSRSPWRTSRGARSSRIRRRDRVGVGD